MRASIEGDKCSLRGEFRKDLEEEKKAQLMNTNKWFQSSRSAYSLNVQSIIEPAVKENQ
ncbi:MAG: hypothetical protein QN716_06045 [Nitrososphaeraceae archaeon]|jgi:hypothetical protein|nr:hypothetical protein [Nitrososphaeraceae archaeon]